MAWVAGVTDGVTMAAEFNVVEADVAGLVAGAAATFVLAADQDNSTTTAAVVPDLSFTPEPDAIYKIDVFAVTTSAVATTGAQVGWKFPTGGILYGALRSLGSNTGTSMRIDQIGISDGQTGRSPVTGSGAGVPFPTQISAVFATGPVVTGDFSVTLQSEDAAVLSTIKAGSVLTVTRLA